MEVRLVLDNIRSTYNVGAILRTAEGFSVSSVIFSGITPRVHDVSLLPHLREKLDKQIHKTALGAEEMVKNYASSDIISTISEYKKQGWKIVGLENNIQDERLILLNDRKLGKKLGEKVVLILGEEVSGIDRKLYELIDVFIEIPMSGRKESFNVSVATGIALYGILGARLG